MARQRDLIGRAREFRGQPTRGEAAVWAAIRRGALGAHFRRQHVVGPFVADFACLRPRVVVEIDGPVHDELLARDEERQRILEELGYRVLRFSSDEAESRTDLVVDTIRRVLTELR